MPRKTSEVTDTAFPFAEDTTPFILVLNATDAQTSLGLVEGVADKDWERGYATAWSYNKKLEMVEAAIRLRGAEDPVECWLLAVWPGERASHVFLVDDLGEARDALG